MHQAITDRIEALRASKGLSVPQLAVASGIPRVTLTRRLHNPETFTLAELARLAEVLETTTRDLALPEAS
jgi:transcriptional regulator with XRE-family HTH domain